MEGAKALVISQKEDILTIIKERMNDPNYISTGPTYGEYMKEKSMNQEISNPTMKLTLRCKFCKKAAEDLVHSAAPYCQNAPLNIHVFDLEDPLLDLAEKENTLQWALKDRAAVYKKLDMVEEKLKELRKGLIWNGRRIW